MTYVHRAVVVGITVLALAGCATERAIYKNYEAHVDVKDGVSEHEAKLIAQRQIVGAMEKRDYRITAPDIRNDEEAKKYPDYWFVLFGHNWLSPISTDPMAKTYTELRETQFLVVIDKLSGDIKFSGQWYPKRAAHFDWVFDQDAYKRDNPIALPPGEKSLPAM